MNLEKEIKINKILLILLITLSVGTIALRTSHAMFSKKETFNNVLRIITGNELPSKSATDDLIKKAGVEGEGLQGIDPLTGAICTSDCKEYRYTGPTVKNYVKLKNKQTSEGAEVEELWRIIGVFTDEDNGEKYMRIIRDEVLPITMFPKNYIVNGITYTIICYDDEIFWSGDSLINDWSIAGLQYYLNSEKDSSNNKGYMSYLSDETKAMLRDTKHYLGTYIWNSETAITSYQHERDIKSCVGGKGSVSNWRDFPVSGCNVWDGNATTWTGSVSLMYPSDYGFAAENSYWTTTSILNYSEGANNTNWMHTTMKDKNSTNSWMITPCSEASFYVMYLSKYSVVYEGSHVDGGYDVRPVLNLKSNVKIKSGSGTQNDPYILEM